MPDATFPQLLARTDAPRFARYRQNLAFYQGKQWSGQGRPRERRLTFNYARTLVEKVTSYLMQGASSVVDPVDGTPEAAVAARRAARRCWGQASRGLAPRNRLRRVTARMLSTTARP